MKEALVSRSGDRDSRNPEATRKLIIAAAKEIIVRDGSEAISVSEVARVAGVNRGTAYLHFRSRDDLIRATLDEVGRQIWKGVREKLPKESLASGIDLYAGSLTEELATFFVDNAPLVRVWLVELLTAGRLKDDRLWKEWLGSSREFAESGISKDGFDPDVQTVIILSAYFMWPMWIEAEKLSKSDKRKAAKRLARDMLRMAMSGNLRVDRLQHLAQSYKENS